MRKLDAAFFISLDGVVESPDKWHFPYFNDEMGEKTEWNNNSTLINGDVADEITKLKRQPGKNISISGSGTLVQWLLANGLLDELRLMVHPIVVGSGKRLFKDGSDRKPLKLVDSKTKTFSTGVVDLTYQPAER
jgi:dihydrofolate reductase